MVLARASTTIFGTVAVVGVTVVLVEVGTGMSVGRVVEDETCGGGSVEVVTMGATVVEDAAAFAVVVVGAIVVLAPAVVVVGAARTVVVSSNPFLFADDEPDDPPHADNMSTLVNTKGRIFIKVSIQRCSRWD